MLLDVYVEEPIPATVHNAIHAMAKTRHVTCEFINDHVPCTDWNGMFCGVIRVGMWIKADAETQEGVAAIWAVHQALTPPSP